MFLSLCGLAQLLQSDTCGPDAELLHLQAVGDMSRFGRIVKFMTFKAFQSAADALEQCNAVAEGSMTEDLRHFLEMNLPKVPTEARCMGPNMQSPCTAPVKLHLSS